MQKLQLRYAGTDSTLTVEFDELDNIRQQFEQSYRQQYGITLPSKGLVVSAMVAEAIGKMAVGSAQESVENEERNSVGDAIATVPLFSADQWHDTPVFQRENLCPGAQLSGPAIILESTGTNIIEPQWTATVNAEGALVLTQQQTARAEHSISKR